jgi:hypothetical protein
LADESTAAPTANTPLPTTAATPGVRATAASACLRSDTTAPGDSGLSHAGQPSLPAPFAKAQIDGAMVLAFYAVLAGIAAWFVGLPVALIWLTGGTP